MKHWIATLAAGLTAATMTAPAANAAETIKAVVIDGYPARALWVKEFTNFFLGSSSDDLMSKQR